MSRAVALGVGKHGSRGGVAIAIPAGEQEDRECRALHFLPDDFRDLTADELRVMVALDFWACSRRGVQTDVGVEQAVQGYLQYLYSPAGQEVAAKHFLRPRLAEVLAKHGETFKPIKTLTIAEVAGSWAQAQKPQFADGGIFDQIFLH